MRNQDLLSGFLTSLFGEIDGYVYVPVKYQGGAYVRNFFKWPEQQATIEDFIQNIQKEADVFISPSIWKRDPGEESLTPNDWLGSQYLWTEFDGQLPKDMKGIPNPSIKVQSSGPDNQHWYWRLSYLETNLGNLETLNKKLTYTLEGDLSSWDYVQVLRPPCTKNHKPDRGHITKLIRNTDEPVSLDSIVGLPDPPKSVFLEEGDFLDEDIPPLAKVLMETTWDDDIKDLLFNKKPKDRSKAMFAVACGVLKKNRAIKNIDLLSILLRMSDNTGKFKNRDNRKKILLGLIAKARLSTGIDQEAVSIEDDLLIGLFNAITVRENIKPVDWIVENVLTHNGITLIIADPGVGKTRIAMQLSMRLALGIPFLNFKVKKPRKVLFVHNEIERDEHELFHGPMMNRFSIEEHQLLAENYLPYFHPEKLFLKTEEDFKRYKLLLNMVEPDIVVLDTLGATAGDPSDYNEMVRFFQMLNQIRAETGIGTIIPHHTRKDPNDVRASTKTITVDKIYGGRPVTQYLTTAIGMWKEQNVEKEKQEGHLPVEFYCIKQRFTANFRPLTLQSTQYADFEVKKDAYNPDDIEEFVDKMSGDEIPVQRKKPSTGRGRRESYSAQEDTDILDF